MARKFGKKNTIKINPIDYNIGLIGESGIGKTTLAKEFCEKLVGDDGYILLNIGKEDAVDAISGVVYEDIPNWATFEEFTDDIIENRLTDYKNLKMLVYDTLDQFFDIAEAEVIRMNNSDPERKEAKTIKSAFGGYQAGEDKTTEIILNKLWELKSIGISFFILGHTKRRTMKDPTSGTEYDMLTTNMMHKYFNSINTKLHFLGIASIDRAIEQRSIIQNFNKQVKKVGKVTNEKRIITFRDDDYTINSKSRFKDVTPCIQFDTDLFIEALQEAIKIEAEKDKSNKSIEKRKKEQELAKEQKVEKKVEAITTLSKNKKLISQIKNNLKGVDADSAAKLKEIMSREEITSFNNPEAIETKVLEEIVSIFN